MGVATRDSRTGRVRPWGNAPLPRKARGLVTVAGGVLLLVLAAIAFDLGSGQPALCSSCHEMRSAEHTWKQSAHRVVACVKCHEAPTAWYQLPERIGGRIALLSRDVNAHWSTAYAEDADLAAMRPLQETSDEICLQCHDPNRKSTSGYRILIDHPEHAKRNGSCVSCHVLTAHPEPSRGGPLSLMGQCYTCHGTTEYASAPTGCSTCHPSDYDPLPASHKQDGWADSHGQTWESDAKLCSMCHEQSFCTSCHGVEMPHPEGWSDGKNEHAAAGTASPATCEKCHEGGQQLCSECHHASYGKADGTWLERHPSVGRTSGVASCFECHEARTCSYCHTKLVERGSP